MMYKRLATPVLALVLGGNIISSVLPGATCRYFSRAAAAEYTSLEEVEGHDEKEDSKKNSIEDILDSIDDIRNRLDMMQRELSLAREELDNYESMNKSMDNKLSFECAVRENEGSSDIERGIYFNTKNSEGGVRSSEQEAAGTYLALMPWGQFFFQGVHDKHNFSLDREHASSTSYDPFLGPIVAETEVERKLEESAKGLFGIIIGRDDGLSLRFNWAQGRHYERGRILTEVSFPNFGVSQEALTSTETEYESWFRAAGIGMPSPVGYFTFMAGKAHNEITNIAATRINSNASYTGAHIEEDTETFLMELMYHNLIARFCNAKTNNTAGNTNMDYGGIGCAFADETWMPRNIILYPELRYGNREGEPLGSASLILAPGDYDLGKLFVMSDANWLDDISSRMLETGALQRYYLGMMSYELPIGIMVDMSRDGEKHFFGVNAVQEIASMPSISGISNPILCLRVGYRRMKAENLREEYGAGLVLRLGL